MPISPFGLMGRLFLGRKVMSSMRRKKIQDKIDEMGPNQIIQDFVIDMSPFVVPPDIPNNRDVERAQNDTQFGEEYNAEGY